MSETKYKIRTNNFYTINKGDIISDYNISLDTVYDVLKSDEFMKILTEFNENVKTNTASMKTQISNLIEAYKNENLVLVLGAGISIPFNIPDWDTLLKTLLIEVNTKDSSTNTNTIATEIYANLFNINPLITARYLQEIYKNQSSKMGFESSVRNLIYKTIKRENKSEVMDEIVKLCISPGRNPNIDSIITYNYDDVLEKKIEEKNIGVKVKSIFHTGINIKSGEIPIYHVHGFLPENQKLTENHAITLSESIYHQQYLDVYSWNNIVQLNKFTDKICLFIGSSFSDPNIRRLMDIAKKQRGGIGKHYIVKKKICDKDIETQVLEAMKQNEGNKDDIDISVSDLIMKIIETYELLEEKDAQSFGMEIIWVIDYEEDIPKILKSIRNQKIDSNFS